MRGRGGVQRAWDRSESDFAVFVVFEFYGEGNEGIGWVDDDFWGLVGVEPPVTERASTVADDVVVACVVGTDDAV